MSFPGDRVRSAPALRQRKENALSTDWYTKLVLTVLAASAAFLAVQRLESAPAAGEGRFRLQAVPMARLLLLLDTDTGKTWTTAINKPDAWQEIAASPIDKLGQTAAEAAAEKEAELPLPKPAAEPMRVTKPEMPPADEP